MAQAGQIGKLNLAPDRKSRFKQGKYTLKNSAKYLGDPTNLIYRSGLERRFYRFFDENPNILQWGCEEMSINYYNVMDKEKKVHRYFPDAIIRIKTRSGGIETFIVEIKPSSQCSEPKKKRSTKKWMREMETWLTNKSKWEAAQRFASKNKMKFIVLNETHLEKA